MFEFYNGAVKEINYARKKMLAATDASNVCPERFNVTILPGYSEKTECKFKGMGNDSFGSGNSDLIVKFK